MTTQQKAQVFLQAQAAGDPRCQMLLMFLSMAINLPQAACQTKIEELARG